MAFRAPLRLLMILQLLEPIITHKALQAEAKEQKTFEESASVTERTHNPISTSYDKPTETVNNAFLYFNSERTSSALEATPFHHQDIRHHLGNISTSPGYVSGTLNVHDSSSSIRPEDVEFVNIRDEEENLQNTSLYYYYYDYDDDNDFSENVLRQISFTKTLYFCEYLFSAMYGEYSSFPESGITYDNQSVVVIHDEKFINACAPFYDLYNKNCSDMGTFTFCADENVLFLNQQECQKPSDHDVHFEHLLAAALLAEDKTCFQSVCTGSTRLIDHVVNGIHVRLFHTDKMRGDTICSGILQNYYLLNEKEEVYGLKNVHWPCCYPDHTMLLADDPQKHEMLRSWNYLTPKCQEYEMTILVIICIMTTIGITGNIVVIIVLFGKQCLSTGLELLNISLAISDLLLCLFVMAPAVHMHILLMNEDREEVIAFKSYDDIMRNLEYGEVPSKSGHYLFFSFVFNCCTINSIHILFALSYKRLEANAKIPLLDRFPPFNAKISVGIFWIVSLLTSFIIMHDDNGFNSEWNSYAKLPLGVSTKGKRVILPSLMGILGVECAITIVISGMAVYYYREIKKTEVRRETTNGNEEENLTLPMIMMTVFFTISTVSGGTATIIYVHDIKFYQSELVCSLCWWSFLCSTSWNPWLYHLGYRKFRDKATERTKAITAALCWGGSWKPSESGSNQSLGEAEGVTQYSSQQNLPTISASVEGRFTHSEISV
ncbi:uncharacterized protein LOC135211012 [Macrobrachium nipponense]|uniref:uncharacterized protein LOC135211012 n=1 Tax=Macrobrachium nipponense TaxID=159736 RepID=UPI0030C83503